MQMYKRIAAIITCAVCLLSGYSLAELKQGDRSSQVKKLQTRLIQLNYLPKDTELSKNFGPLTKLGVEAFQERNSIEVTGVVDDKTEDAIYSKKAKKAKKSVEVPEGYYDDSAKDKKAASTGDEKAAADTQAAKTESKDNLVLTNDLSLLSAYPELQNDQSILKYNPGLAEQLAARQAALNALNAKETSSGGSSAVSSGSASSAQANTSASTVAPALSGGIEAVIQFGMTLIGKPYKNGGRGPDSFDCSGFLSYILGQYGYKRPGSSQDISDYAGWTTIADKSQLQRGDIVLFHTTGRSVAVGHSGIYLGDGTFLHSEPSNGVVITPMFDYNGKGEKTYYHANYLWAKRVS